MCIKPDPAPLEKNRPSDSPEQNIAQVPVVEATAAAPEPLSVSDQRAEWFNRGFRNPNGVHT